MQRKRKGNDRQAYQSHIKRQEAYERGWLDDADEEYPDYGEAEAYDTEKKCISSDMQMIFGFSVGQKSRQTGR